MTKEYSADLQKLFLKMMLQDAQIEEILSRIKRKKIYLTHLSDLTKFV